MPELSEKNTDAKADALKQLEDMRIRLQNNPEDHELRHDYADELNENGFAKEAIKQYRYLISVFTDHPGLYYSLGVALEKNDELDLAVDAYKNAVRIDPCFVDGHYNLAYAYDRLEMPLLAIHEYKETIALDPEDSNAHFNLGCVLSKCNDSEGAIKHLKKSIDINPKDEYAHFYLAYEMQKLGNIEEAIKGYRSVLEINSGYSWSHFNLGFIYLSQGKKQQAYEEFLATYNLNPMDEEAFRKLITVGIDCEFYDATMDILEDRVVMNPKNAFIQFSMAEVYFKQSDYEDALHHYTLSLASPDVNNSGVDIKAVNLKIQKLKTLL